MKNLLRLLILSTLLTACDALTGEEVGRLKINQLSTEGNLNVKETTLNLKKDDDIGIWSDIDIAYEGDIGLRFRLEVLKDGKVIDRFEVDPMDKNITLGEFRTSVNGKTDWSFTGKNMSYMITEDGQYTFKAIFVASDNPTLKVTKAELVFKR